MLLKTIFQKFNFTHFNSLEVWICLPEFSGQSGMHFEPKFEQCRPTYCTVHPLSLNVERS
jgi:uncharacterized radical SAM superfamily Fe-S cluster-containing enzyme